MQIVINEYLKDGPVTTLRITGVVVIDVLVDTDIVEHLKRLNWCYDQYKRDVYATDPSMEIPSLFGIASPRVFLWKYVVYCKTGTVAHAWRGRAKNDYRYGNGSVIVERIVG